MTLEKERKEVTVVVFQMGILSVFSGVLKYPKLQTKIHKPVHMKGSTCEFSLEYLMDDLSV